MNDNVFTLNDVSAGEASKVLESDVQRVQFNNWQRDVLHELKTINTNIKLLKKRTEFVAAFIIAGIAFALIYPWLNSF